MHTAPSRHAQLHRPSPTVSAVVRPARKERTEADNKFVPLPSGFRWAAIGLATLLIATVAIAYLLNPGDKSPFLVPAFCFAVIGIWFPLFQDPAGRGWLHPLIFTALMSGGMLLRKLPTFIGGLSSHNGLSLVSAARLNELAAYEMALYGLAGFLYLIGFAAGRHIKIRPREERLPTAVPFKTVIAVLFAAVALLLYVNGKGGLIAHIQDWSHRAVKLEGQGFWQPITAIGVGACLMWLSADVRAVRSMTFWGCVAIALPVYYLTFGGRSALIFSTAMLFMVFILRTRRVPYIPVIAALLASLIALGVLGSFRRSTWNGGAINWDVLQNFDAMDQLTAAGEEMVERSGVFSPTIAILDKVPDRVPLLLGKSYIALIALPIPKAIWPGKPELIARKTARVFFGLVSGAPPSPIGEAYWNFHIPGVIIYFLLFGLYHRWLAEMYAANVDRPFSAALFAVTLFMTRGDTTAVVNWLVLFAGMVLMVAVYRFGGKKQPASPQNSALGTYR